jgi:hypothetical protein
MPSLENCQLRSPPLLLTSQEQSDMVRGQQSCPFLQGGHTCPESLIITGARLGLEARAPVADLGALWITSPISPKGQPCTMKMAFVPGPYHMSRASPLPQALVCPLRPSTGPPQRKEPRRHGPERGGVWLASSCLLPHSTPGD